MIMRSMVTGAAVALALAACAKHEAPAWYTAAAGDVCISRLAPDSIASADNCDSATIHVGRDEVVLAGGAILERVDKGESLQLRRGKARFRVAARTPRERPFEVKVSAGAVIALGTSFAVEQGAKHGSVAVDDGRVEFRWTDGSAPVALTAGEHLEWPLPARPTPVPSTASVH